MKKLLIILLFPFITKAQPFTNISRVAGLQQALNGKQATLISGENIKTINGFSLLGSGDLVITTSSGGVDTIYKGGEALDTIYYKIGGNTYGLADLQGVVSVMTGNGLTGGTITSIGTLKADTSILSTKYYRQKGLDSLAAIATHGTVTSVALSIPNFPLTVSGSPVTSSGTLTATPNGSQGALIYFSSSNVVTTLAKDANATRYLSNTGSGNNPAWDQVQLANGVGGNLSATHLNNGTGASIETFWNGSEQWLPAVTSISTTAPLQGGDITTTGTITIDQATTSTDGYLSSTDWNLFKNKVSTSRTISANFGLSGGGDLSSNISFAADTTSGGVLSWVRGRKLTDSLVAIIATKGTVTSVATGYGLSGGTITTSGTLLADSLNLSSRQWRQKGDDSLGLLIAAKFTLPSLTSGSVLFSDGSTISQNNANFFWDNTNARLGIGTAMPVSSIEVLNTGVGATQDTIYGFYLRNTTAATLNNQKYSPPLTFEGYGWKTAPTSATRSARLRMYLQPVQGTSNITSKFVWESSINAASFTEIMSLTSSGILTTSTLSTTGAATVGGINSTGLMSQYNNINTAGWGIPAIYGSGRATAQTAANASVATYTVGGSDGSFTVSANVLVTTSGTENFTVTLDYTDEGNTARTETLSFTSLAGAGLAAIAFANGAVPYSGIPVHIRCKASTAITVKTAAGGTYTGCTYNVEATITQIK